MRTIKYEEWKKQRRAMFRKAVAIENTFEGRAPGNRPRDPEKEKLLARLDKAKLERYLASGKIVILGPHHWKWRIDYKRK